MKKRKHYTIVGQLSDLNNRMVQAFQLFIQANDDCVERASELVEQGYSNEAIAEDPAWSRANEARNKYRTALIDAI